MLTPTTPAVSAAVSRVVSAFATGTDVWNEVRRLSVTTRRLNAIVEDLRLVSLSGGAAVVQAGGLAAMARSAQKEIEDLLTKAAGRKITLTIQTADAARAPAAEGTPGAASTAPAAAAAPGTDIRQHPLVKQAEALLGARVVRVEGRTRAP